MTGGYVPRHIQPDRDLTVVSCAFCGCSERLSGNVNLALDELHDFIGAHADCGPVAA